MFVKLIDQGNRDVYVNVSRVAMVIRDDATAMLRVAFSGGAHVEVPASNENITALSKAMETPI